MTAREREIEKALIDWFKREGFEIDRDHLAEDGGCTINLPELARHIADEIKS